jgi:serine/threonine protein kinase
MGLSSVSLITEDQPTLSMFMVQPEVSDEENQVVHVVVEEAAVASLSQSSLQVDHLLVTPPAVQGYKIYRDDDHHRYSRLFAEWPAKDLVSGNAVRILAFNKVISWSPREISMRRLVKHPNLDDIIDFIPELGGNRGLACAVQELVDGFSWTQLIYDGMLMDNVQETCRIANGVLQGLHLLHTWKLIHGDVRPDNVVIEKLGERSTERRVVLCSMPMSKPAMMCLDGGHYLSPELVADGELRKGDYGSDMWSLAVSLFESLAQRRPFDSTDESTLFTAIMIEELPICLLPLAGDSCLGLFLQKALHKDAQMRFETSESMQQALCLVAAQESALDVVRKSIQF